MRGLSYPVYTVGAINAIFFGVYTRTLDSLSTSSAMDSSKLLSVFTAGCVAGAAQLSLAVPVDLVKVRLQADQGERMSGDYHGHHGHHHGCHCHYRKVQGALGLSEERIQTGGSEGLLQGTGHTGPERCEGIRNLFCHLSLVRSC